VTGEDAAAIVGQARALAESLERVWIHGQASPWPGDVLARKGSWEPKCEFCDFRTVCRSDHEPTRMRLETSGALNEIREAMPKQEEDQEKDSESEKSETGKSSDRPAASGRKGRGR
jgi:hypothetical protein